MSSTRKTLEHLGPAYYLPVNAAAAAAAAEAAAAAKAAKVAAAATATAAKAAAAATTVTAAKAAAAVAEAAAEAAWGFGGGVAAAAEGVQAATGAGGTAFGSGAIIDITSRWPKPCATVRAASAPVGAPFAIISRYDRTKIPTTLDRRKDIRWT